jgi:hypothetical protein
MLSFVAFNSDWIFFSYTAHFISTSEAEKFSCACEQILVMFLVIRDSACTCHQDICQIVLPFSLCSLCATTWHFASESTVLSCSGSGFSQASDRVLSLILIFMLTFSIVYTKHNYLWLLFSILLGLIKLDFSDVFVDVCLVCN